MDVFMIVVDIIVVLLFTFCTSWVQCLFSVVIHLLCY